MTDILNLFDRYKKAVLEKDVEAFVAIFDENVHIFDMWDQWTHQGLDAWRAMAGEWFASLGSDELVVTFEDIKTHEMGDMACASAFVKFAAFSPEGKELRYLQNRLSWVAQKKKGEWKIIHEHTSSPVDSTTLKVALKRPA